MSKKTTAKKAAAAQQTAEPAKAVQTPNSSFLTPHSPSVLALGLCVLVTLPPAWKMEDPDARPYWQIEIKDQQGRRYSDVYRVKELVKARDLAERIAKDRKIPIVTQEPPAPKKPEAESVPMADPETDAEEVAPF